MNLSQDFTTPQFADTLKEYGIEIDSIFYWRGIVDITAGYKLCVEPFEYINKEIAIGWLKQSVISDKVSLFNKIPAYPLTQVLRWLPMVRTEGHIVWNLTVRYNKKDGLGASYMAFNRKIKLRQPIEELINQGLREGWLTKDIILKNAAL